MGLGNITAAGRRVLEPHGSPVRVNQALSTAMNIALRAYYIHLSIHLQDWGWGIGVRSHGIYAVLGFEARHRFYVSGGRPGAGGTPRPWGPSAGLH